MQRKMDEDEIIHTVNHILLTCWSTVSKRCPEHMLLCYSSRLFNCRELACHLKSHGPCGVKTLLYCSVYINKGVVQKGLRSGVNPQSLCEKSVSTPAISGMRTSCVLIALKTFLCCYFVAAHNLTFLLLSLKCNFSMLLRYKLRHLDTVNIHEKMFPVLGWKYTFFNLLKLILYAFSIVVILRTDILLQ